MNTTMVGILVLATSGCAVAPRPYPENTVPPVPRIAYVTCVLSNCNDAAKNIAEADVVYMSCFLSRCGETVK